MTANVIPADHPLFCKYLLIGVGLVSLINKVENLSYLQQHIPIKAIFARIRGNQSFWLGHISSMIYKGPIATWRVMAT